MSKIVMIVEDNELNMKLFHDLLEAHGYHPIGTRDGIEGSISPARSAPAYKKPTPSLRLVNELATLIRKSKVETVLSLPSVRPHPSAAIQ